MSHIPAKSDNPDGLHARYIVSKADGTPVDPNAEYFVLRLDMGASDPIHRSACIEALLTYAIVIRNHLPKLSEDLFQRYGALYRRDSRESGPEQQKEKL